MADVDLLPLPEPALEWPTGLWLRNGSYVQPGNYYTDEQVRSCVSSATEVLRADHAALRAEYYRVVHALQDEQARAERLAEALRMFLQAGVGNSTDFYVQHNATLAARAALEQEDRNG